MLNKAIYNKSSIIYRVWRSLVHEKKEEAFTLWMFAPSGCNLYLFLLRMH